MGRTSPDPHHRQACLRFSYRRQVLFDDVIRAWQVVIPSFGIVQGPFHIASLDYRGDHAGEVTFDLALESAGALIFTAI